MADGFIQVATDSIGKKLQTYENTVGANSVHAEAVTLVSSAGAELFPTVVSSFDHGKKSSIGLTAVQINSSSVSAKIGVTVKASRDNTSIIYIGNSDVTADTTDATDGWELFPGEAFTFKVNNVNLLYAIAKATGQEVFWVTE